MVDVQRLDRACVTVFASCEHVGTIAQAQGTVSVSFVSEIRGFFPHVVLDVVDTRFFTSIVPAACQKHLFVLVDAATEPLCASV